MAQNYTSVVFRDFHKGIQQLSAESEVGPGHVEDSLNADCASEGQVEKRKGYETHAHVPMRVVRMTQTTTGELCFYLDGSMDLSLLRSSPIVVAGTTSQAAGANPDFTATFGSRWYSGFTVDTLFTYPVGLAQSNTLTEEQHGFTSATAAMLGAARSTSEVARNNEVNFLSSMTFNPTTRNAVFTLDNLGPSPVKEYLYMLDNTPVAGDTYFADFTTGALVSGVTLPASTHNLATANILVQCFERVAGVDTMFIPDAVTNTNGDIEVSWTLGALTNDVRVCLRAVPVAKLAEGTCLAGDQTTVSLTGLETPFLISQAFLETSPGVWSQVIPDSVMVDDLLSTAVVSFTNATASDARFRVLFAEATVRTSKLCVDAQTTVASNFDTALLVPSDLQLTLWGLYHTEVYAAPRVNRPGWVTAVDSYRAEGESFVVASLGWGLFREATRVAEGTTWLMPSQVLSLNNRSQSTRILAPLLSGATDTVVRTRGGYTVDGGEEGWADLVSVAYAGTPGEVLVTLSTPNRTAVLNNSGSQAGFVLEENARRGADQLTIRDALWSKHNGSFVVLDFDFSSPTQLTFQVRNTLITTSDYDFTGQGRAGVFTDLAHLDVFDSYAPVVGDVLTSTSFANSETLSVLGAISNVNTNPNVVLGPLTGPLALPAGQAVALTHTGRSFPLIGPTSDNFVRGDTLTIEGQPTEQPRVTLSHYVNDQLPCSLTIDADTLEATLTIISGNVAPLSQGQTLCLTHCGALSGEWRILRLTGDATVTLTPGSDVTQLALATYAGEGATLCTVQYQQVELSLVCTLTGSTGDNVRLTVEKRLVPVEFPDSAELGLARTSRYNTRQLSASEYDEQPFVRTTMANDALFATNGADPVMRFDGTSLVRAGVPRWSPLMMLALANSTSGGTIPLPSGVVVNGTTTSGVFTATAGVDLQQLEAVSPGDSVVGTTAGVGRVLTVATVNETTGAVTFVEPGVGSVTTLTTRALARYRYYVRADAVDANGFVLASATFADQDFGVELTASSAVLVRLAALPYFRGLDYDRLRLQLYRTKGTGVEPFYRVSEQDFVFGNGHLYDNLTLRSVGAYIDFRDATPDEVLTATQQDPLAPTLSRSTASGDVFPTLEAPPRASVMTTVGNQLVYAGLRSWPRVKLQLVPQAQVAVQLQETWLVRKDNNDTAETTDMVNRVGLRFVRADGQGGLARAATISGFGTNTFDVTIAGLASAPLPGAWVYLTRNTAAVNPRLTLAGWWQVESVVSATTVRIRFEGLTGVTYDAARDPTLAVLSDDPAAPTDSARHVPVWLGADTLMLRSRADSVESIGTAGKQAADCYKITIRAAAALSAVSRSTRATQPIYSQGNFSPWFTAFAGDTYPTDGATLLLEFPVTLPTTPELALGVDQTADRGGFIVFGNDTQRDTVGPATVGAVELVRPSRVAFALANFPELVDAPFADNAIQTKSCVDVNPSDGQFITSIVPFFGESAFGGANTSGQLVVLKTDSIYLVNPATRDVTRIESQGVGCSAPHSVAVTRQGVIFAHTSGIYRLTRQLSVEPLGANLERLWQLTADRRAQAVANMRAHNYTNGRKWRLFLPQQDDVGDSGDTPRCSAVFSYDYTAEQKGESGSWSRYDTHPVTDACNLSGESYLGTWQGKLLRLLRTESPLSYRDDDAPVGTTRVVDMSTGVLTPDEGIGMRVDLAATDLGDPTIRKKVLHMLLNFRLPRGSETLAPTMRNVLVSQAANMSFTWRTLDSATLEGAGVPDGISDSLGVKQTVIRYAPATSRADYHQLRVEDKQLCAPVQVVSCSWRVAGLNTRGTTEARGTRG